MHVFGPSLIVLGMDATQNTVTVNGKTVRVDKYHRADLAFASAERNNGSRKQSPRGPGGAQFVVLGDLEDKWGAYWVADCNRSASVLLNAGFDCVGV